MKNNYTKRLKKFFDSLSKEQHEQRRIKKLKLQLDQEQAELFRMKQEETKKLRRTRL